MTTATSFRGLDPCVHCGFCLQACPTFLVTGDEADSPRGRIVLMQGLAAGRLTPDDPDLRLHLDRCLGCRACEPACPSGVAYGSGLEAARERLARATPIPRTARAVHAVMREPWLRTPLLALARTARPFARPLAGRSRLGFAMGMLAATAPTRSPTDEREPRGKGGERAAPPPPSRPSPPSPVTLLRGCIMDGLFGHVQAATERVLRVNGYEIVVVEGQGCCGALHAHAGQHEIAVQLADRNVAAFSVFPDAHIAVNSAGCGATMKEYGRAGSGGPRAAAVAARVRDVSELLAARGPKRGAPLALRVAYDPPCHLMHAQRVQEPPETLLDAVPGLTRVRHEEADLCCGSAGSYSLVEPDMSRAVLARKVDALIECAPDVVATGNPGCIMQIGAGLRAAGRNIPVVHPVELLDWSYRRAGYYDD